MSSKIAIIAAIALAAMAWQPAQAQQAPGGGQQQQTTPPPKPPEPPKDPPPRPSNNFSPQGRTFGPDNGANIRP